MSDYVHKKHGLVTIVEWFEPEGPYDGQGWAFVRTAGGRVLDVNISDLTPLKSNKHAIGVVKDAALETNQLLQQILVELRELRADFQAVHKGEYDER